MIILTYIVGTGSLTVVTGPRTGPRTTYSLTYREVADEFPQLLYLSNLTQTYTLLLGCRSLKTLGTR
jgi:hypothetical protein